MKSIGKGHVMLVSGVFSFLISLLAIRLANTNATVAKVTKSPLGGA